MFASFRAFYSQLSWWERFPWNLPMLELVMQRCGLLQRCRSWLSDTASIQLDVCGFSSNSIKIQALLSYVFSRHPLSSTQTDCIQAVLCKASSEPECCFLHQEVCTCFVSQVVKHILSSLSRFSTLTYRVSSNISEVHDSAPGMQSLVQHASPLHVRWRWGYVCLKMKMLRLDGCCWFILKERVLILTE